MNAFFERWIFFGVVLLSFLCAWRASARPPVTVHKLFHHTACDTNNIELGSFVLYGNGFAKEPLNKSVRSLDDSEEYTFIIPHAMVQDFECRRKIQELNKNSEHKGYRLTIEQVKSAEPAIAIKFMYPKGQCVVSYAYIDSIQREKGIVFHVYNSSLMHSLKKQQSPVIRTAALLHSPPILFIDPGHGGADAGAIARSGITEKEVCLAVSKKVEVMLTAFGHTVFSSRNKDLQVPLDVRTQLASKSNTDLVVSIHANAAPSHKAAGVEIFFLDPHFLDQQQGVTVEMGALLKKYRELRSTQSRLLAEAIHTEVCAQLPDHNSVFKDRGIKTAVSQILLGVGRPAVLIEIGFLTNSKEAQLLSDKNYQSIVAKSIALGIHNYCVNMQV